MHPKEAKLRDILQSYESMAIAWSGGVDSTFLAAFAHEVLDGRVLMMNARSPSFAPEATTKRTTPKRRARLQAGKNQSSS